MSDADRVPLPMKEWSERVHWTADAPAVDETLAQVQVPARVVEEFRPLAESLECRLASLYWRRAGVLPFAQNEVPFLVNNSGRLSEAAAHVLFASCLASAGPDEPIVVLELGAGSGLFALLLLNNFRALCEEAGRDFYRRLRYVVTDLSPATVRHWHERRVFAEHEAQVLCQVVDANRLELALPAPARAVFCNYLLDVLPAAMVRGGPDGAVEQLCVRTHLAKDPPTGPPTAPLSLEEVRALAAAGDDDSLARLLPLLDAFEHEVAFRPDGVAALAGAAEAVAAAPAQTRVRLSVGALRCLLRLAERLAPDGFILASDYGPVSAEEMATYASLQRFGKTVASGINFPWLEGELARAGLHAHKAAGDDGRSLHTRLVGARLAPAVQAAFADRFSGEAFRHVEARVEEARAHIAAGRKTEALETYRSALGRHKRDWALLCEVADFLNSQVGDHHAAIDLGRAAVAINPHYSTWLWNVLGDSLYNLQRYAEAHEAYLQAERIDPRDPSTNLNLAYTHLQFGAFAAALAAIAKGLEHDTKGLFRDRLLDKQRHVLIAMSEKAAAADERLARRNRRLA